MIRIIYDYDLEKYKEQYRQIKDFFPPHELYIYESMGKLSESLPYKSVDYNIYLDCISENVYFNMPSKKTILIVNEEYLTHIHHLRRENYKDAELILLEDVVDYYVYLSEYSKEILMKKYPRKSISFNNFIKKYLIEKSSIQYIRIHIIRIIILGHLYYLNLIGTLIKIIQQYFTHG